jgi:hypothetical protein
LLPIPAALMRLVEGRIEFVATNQRFNMTGFGPSAPASPIIEELGGAITHTSKSGVADRAF